MFKQLKAVGTIFENYMIRRGRVEARRILLNQDEKALRDIGISRIELQSGVKNWPWDGSVTSQKLDNQIKQFKAIRELSKYSDRELQDIGINRSMIVDAVKNGRPMYDNDQPMYRPLANETKQEVA